MAQGETPQCGSGAAPRHHPSVAQAGRMALAAGLALLPMNTVRAQAPQPAQVPEPASQSSPVSSAPPPGPVPPTPPGLLQSLQTQSSLLGDMLGVRPWLAARGITAGINETSEVLANVTGGVKTGPAYDGLTLLSAGLDTERSTEGSPHHPHTRTVPVEPGVIEEYVIRLYPITTTFLPGHRLVVELSNDEPLADDHNALLPPDAFHLPVGRPVTHKIYRDAHHPSRLVLPFPTRTAAV